MILFLWDLTLIAKIKGKVHYSRTSIRLLKSAETINDYS